MCISYYAYRPTGRKSGAAGRKLEKTWENFASALKNRVHSWFQDGTIPYKYKICDEGPYVLHSMVKIRVPVSCPLLFFYFIFFSIDMGGMRNNFCCSWQWGIIMHHADLTTITSMPKDVISCGALISLIFLPRDSGSTASCCLLPL